MRSTGLTVPTGMDKLGDFGQSPLNGTSHSDFPEY